MCLPENFQLYEENLLLRKPPTHWPETLQAMWWDANDNWQNSHEIAQEIKSSIGNWIHAYLHRKEGDLWNARYWYHRANRDFPSTGLIEEHKEIVNFIIENQSIK